MDGCRVGQHQLIEFAKAVSEFAAVEVDGKLALLHIDARHDAEVTVVNLLIVVVLDQHDLSPRQKVQPNRSTLNVAGPCQGS